MNHNHDSHIINGYLSELSLSGGLRSRVQVAARAAVSGPAAVSARAAVSAPAVSAPAVSAVGAVAAEARIAAPAVAAVAASEPRSASRARGDRPGRFAGIRGERSRPCFGAA